MVNISVASAKLSEVVRYFGHAWAVLRGAYPRKKSTLKNLRRFDSDKSKFVSAGGKITHDYPIFGDYEQQSGVAQGHYFHQDLLVARFVHLAAPERHIDVGSRVDGLVAHIASYRAIDVIDIRPLTISSHPYVNYIQGDLMNLDASLYDICDSLTCLHAIEHFGLGRYGDPIDPDGHLKGFKNLGRMLRPGGTLYISFPVGRRDEIHFNAHRVFSSTRLLEWSKDTFDLQRFDYVDDAGSLHLNKSPKDATDLTYGCGIYTLKKRPVPV